MKNKKPTFGQSFDFFFWVFMSFKGFGLQFLGNHSDEIKILGLVVTLVSIFALRDRVEVINWVGGLIKKK